MHNRVDLIGNIGKDVELRFTQGGTAIATFSLATNEKWKDKDGEKKEETQWHNIVVWGKKAEFCGEYLSKGDLLLVEGKIKYRTYEKDGTTRYITEIVAHNVQSLGGKKSDKAGGEAAASHTDRSRQEATSSSPANGDDDDDLPF